MDNYFWINLQNNNGIYKLIFNTFNKMYVGPAGRGIQTRYKDHLSYIRTNNQQSAYATHILQNRHEYGPKNDTIQTLKTCSMVTRMNCWETMYMQKLFLEDILIAEEQSQEPNPLYNCT